MFFLLMTLLPPRSTRTHPLFPYPTLFRSRLDVRIAERPATRSQDHARHPPRPIMVEALENGVMLGIDRQKPHAVPRCGRCHHRTGADQRLLVGDRDGGPSLYGRDRKSVV